MATTKSYSSFFRLLFQLLLSHALLPTAAEQRPESCPPFSCGRLSNIPYPFRTKDDPPQCGQSRFQLNCQGNKSTISIGSAEYLVTQILMDEPIFRLVDPNFAGVGSCSLPAQSLSPSALYKLGFWRTSSMWASFMNCTKPISKERLYRPVSCLSRYNSTFIYVFISYYGYELQYLPPQCEFLSMVPVADSIPGLSSISDAFSILKQGFDLQLFVRDGNFKRMVFRRCLNESRSMFFDLIRSKKFTSMISSVVKSETHFASCFEDYFYQTSTFRNTIAVVVFIQIVQLLIVLLMLGRFVVAPIMICLLVAYKLWSIQRQFAIDRVEKFLRHQQMLTPQRYAFTDIIAITRHFKHKLGQGGFGSVYKGELAGGILVAVKMMGNSKCNGDEFISEVSTIGRIHHLNVVRLVAYCSEGSKRALVYEYMPNGSLDKFIFSKVGSNLHNSVSEKLIDIAMGIARGIDYLHRGCDMQILHFDIKPHNILLDHNFTPKISDFGLAKLYPKDNSLVSISAARGTIGYIAPELISRSFGVISQKSDVYSYGMLLMEMAGRRRNVDPLVKSSSQVYYPSWIYDKLSQQQDIKLDNNFAINGLEKKLAIIGLWCIQMKSFDRPTMTKVIEMLEADDVETLPIPPKPFPSSADSILETKTCVDSFSTQLSILSE